MFSETTITTLFPNKSVTKTSTLEFLTKLNSTLTLFFTGLGNTLKFDTFLTSSIPTVPGVITLIVNPAAPLNTIPLDLIESQ